MTYVFRNNTIERFLPGVYSFSGYDDFSAVPIADDYMWWYQVPIKYDMEKLVSEVESYSQKLQYIASQIQDKTLLVITLELWYTANSNESDWRLQDAVERFNQNARHLATQKPNVKILDIGDFTNRYTRKDLIDWKFYFLSQMPLNPRLSVDFQTWLNQKKNGLALNRKKCLVLDLDNTLWNGVLGEDGMEGIKMSGDYPGKAFHYWQEGIRELAKNGIILSICSKNNEADMEDMWNVRTDMVLKKSDFSCIKINWTDKATNIRNIATDLNIGLDSIVFVDDNPTERELVRQMLPMVEVPEWPAHPYELPSFYEMLVKRYFTVYNITEEDKRKTEQYRQNANRAQAMTQYANMEDFIRSLGIKLSIEPISPVTVPRVAQMTQKTNQFNLTTKRYTDRDIRALIEDGCFIYTLSVADKFGDNGITGCIILKPEGEKSLTIDTLLLSCRILGKRIEYAFIKYILSQFSDYTVTSQYIPTEKNIQVCDFYEKVGFDIVEEKDGIKCYKAEIKMLNLWVEDYYSIN